MPGTFLFTHIPDIRFGAERLDDVPGLIAGYGTTVLLVMGKSSFELSGRKDIFLKSLKNNGITAYSVSVHGEPSPELVDAIAGEYRHSGIDVVCAVGGGSTVDTGKAVSAMLPMDCSVFEFLEGVGTGRQHDGRKVPFIAVPTTAGTGSEATKNAVLSRVGRDGFKKSIRHDNFVPDIAVIDPELMLSCPRSVTASTGMDAVTQLLESYVSTKAAPLTDALAESGLRYAAGNLVPACTDGSGNIDVRAGMAYAALMSGITLANAGLGVVHGFASSVGGLFGIPHGALCGTLLGEATAVTIERLDSDPDSYGAYKKKYAKAGAIFGGLDYHSGIDDNTLCETLIQRLRKLTQDLELPRLGAYGITEADIDTIVDLTGTKNNPGSLGREDIRKIVMNRL